MTHEQGQKAARILPSEVDRPNKLDCAEKFPLRPKSDVNAKSMARTIIIILRDVVLQLKSAFKDGTTHIVMAPLEFMQRLAALVPRPRLHLIRPWRARAQREVAG